MFKKLLNRLDSNEGYYDNPSTKKIIDNVKLMEKTADNIQHDIGMSNNISSKDRDLTAKKVKEIKIALTFLAEIANKA